METRFSLSSTHHHHNSSISPQSPPIQRVHTPHYSKSTIMMSGGSLSSATTLLNTTQQSAYSHHHQQQAPNSSGSMHHNHTNNNNHPYSAATINPFSSGSQHQNHHSTRYSTISSHNSANTSSVMPPPPPISSVEKIRNQLLLNQSSNTIATATPTPRKQFFYDEYPIDADQLSILLKNSLEKVLLELEEIWDEVGHNPEERSKQVAKIVTDFKDLCSQTVEMEKNVADQFRRSIESARKELVDKSKALKIEVDSQLMLCTEKLSLADELATLETGLETVRANANAASEELADYREKLIEMHEALGTQLDERWKDITSDLTKPRRHEFQQYVAEMYDIVTNRTSAIIQLLIDCQNLMKEMCIDPDESVLDTQIMGSLIFRNSSSNTTNNENPPSIRSQLETDSCTGISANALKKLTERVSELNGEKRRRKQKLGELGTEIAILWEKLRISADEQRAFTVSVKGLGMDTLMKGEMELKKLKALKEEMIVNLILEARDSIRSLWNEVNMEEFQRRSFTAFYIDDENAFNDEMLNEHDQYIQSLQNRMEKMRPILTIIDKREEILKQRMEYEELQKDPERLQQRGAALTKQLMHEEKIQRRVKKDLPKYTDVLYTKLREWKQENGEPFLYNGEPYIEIIKQQDEEWRKYKDEEMQHRLKKKQMEKTKNLAAKTGGTGLGRSRSVSRGRVGGRPLADGSSKNNRNKDIGKGSKPGRAQSRQRPRTASDLRSENMRPVG